MASTFALLDVKSIPYFQLGVQKQLNFVGFVVLVKVEFSRRFPHLRSGKTLRCLVKLVLFKVWVQNVDLITIQQQQECLNTIELSALRVVTDFDPDEN